MTSSDPTPGPSAIAGGLPNSDAPLPYAFERVQRDSDGQEAARLEAQNLLLEKLDPLALVPPTAPDGTILDLGSGTGFWALRLAARVPQGRVVCLDRSLDLLDRVRQRMVGATAAKVEVLHQDLRDLHLPEAAYDLIFTCMVLAHVQDLEAVLAEAARALKPGGWIACFEPLQQSRSFAQSQPPSPNLDFLLDQLLEVVELRGSDLAVSLKIAHLLDRLGLEAVTLRDFGLGLHGEDAVTCIREVFLPLVRAYLRHRWDPEALARRLRAADQEARTAHLWLDHRRAVVLARRPA